MSAGEDGHHGCHLEQDNQARERDHAHAALRLDHCEEDASLVVVGRRFGKPGDRAARRLLQRRCVVPLCCAAIAARRRLRLVG